MKKLFIVLFLTFNILLLTFNLLFSQAKTKVKITLDTKLLINIACDLDADGEGGPSALEKVYMHSGLCTTGEEYCKKQITPYASLVWEHVVGNWGDTPKDDGVGLMTTVGNGVYTIELIVEDYYSNPDLVNSDWNFGHTIQSTPMVAGSIPYVIGLVFRDPTGVISGRDDMCSDLFIEDINKGKPVVVQSSDLGADFRGALTINVVTGIDEQFSSANCQLSIAPNPFTESTHISYTLNQNSDNVSVSVTNLLGQQVAELFNGSQPLGLHSVAWEGTDNKGNKLEKGLYLINVKIANSLVSSRKVILN